MRYYYDLHVHSCLSPCADDDSTPCNIAGMAKLCGLHIVALTDHNSCKNCPAFFEAAREYGIIPIAGMELTTSEDIHAVCLFPSLEKGMEFDRTVDSLRVKIPNRPDIFGEQLILNSSDEVIGKEEYLLSNATAISLEDLPELVGRFGGVCYPAHIDRDANGVIAVLGTFPDTPYFKCYELHEPARLSEFKQTYSLEDKIPVFSSDAHYLTQFSDGESFFELDAVGEEEVVARLFELLR